MLVLGHRGASVAAKENTTQAFVLAEAMGADGVELDVRLAPDGRLIVKHDPLTGDPAELDDHLELADALDACGDMLVNVEIKNIIIEPDYDPSCAVVEPTIAVLRTHGPDDRWIISSFDWETIQRCRVVAPEIATAFLVVTAGQGVIDKTAAAGHLALHPRIDAITPDIVAACHAAGLACNAWTCNDPERIREFAEWGVDGVCTDVPDVALETIGRRISPPARWGTPA